MPEEGAWERKIKKTISQKQCDQGVGHRGLLPPSSNRSRKRSDGGRREAKSPPANKIRRPECTHGPELLLLVRRGAGRRCSPLVSAALSSPARAVFGISIERGSISNVKCDHSDVAS